MKIELGHETVIETATQEDIDYVEENFREGERAEHRVFGGKRTQLSDFETCWTVRHRGDVIGYFGIAIPLEAIADIRKVSDFLKFLPKSAD